jgi:hypothetical protein
MFLDWCVGILALLFGSVFQVPGSGFVFSFRFVVAGSSFQVLCSGVNPEPGTSHLEPRTGT